MIELQYMIFCSTNNCDSTTCDLIFNAVTAFATLATFISAIVLAIIISFKRELRHKQLDTVFELTGQLQNLRLYFSYLIITLHEEENHISGDIWFYFFEMTNDKLKEQEQFNKGNPTIYISEKFLYENDIFQFVHNPFLPKEIALKLINLYPRGGNQFKYNLNQNEVYISDDRQYANYTYRQEISQYYMTIENLFNATQELHKSIRSWLKRYGVKGLNLMEKPINLKNYP